MTAPVPAPEETEDQESSSIIPVLLTVAAMYATYRATHGPLSGHWRTIATTLGIQTAVGGAFTAIALRALDTQRRAAGRAGDELWTTQPRAAVAGMDAGIRTVVQSLRWLDTHVSDRDERAFQEGPRRPTAANPPVVLAEVTVKAIANAAQIRAAEMVGWRSKVWQTMQDPRVRDSHRVMQGQRRDLREEFVTGNGVRIAYPGDPTAPIDEWIQCRCWLRTARR